MKQLSNYLKKAVIAALVLSPLATFAQQPKIQNLRAYDQSGINVFETPKETTVPFDGVKVRFGYVIFLWVYYHGGQLCAIWADLSLNPNVI